MVVVEHIKVTLVMDMEVLEEVVKEVEIQEEVVEECTGEIMVIWVLMVLVIIKVVMEEVHM